MIAELVEGLVYVAASNLHWGGKRWKQPKVATAAYQYQVQYCEKRVHAMTHSQT